MGGESPHDLLDSILAGTDPSPTFQRAAHRRLFREMIKGELETGALSFWRRRALVRFARKLAIAPPEAKWIIRAVEYEVGLRTATVDELIAADETASRQRLESAETTLRIGLAILLATLYCLLARWIFNLAF